jgi:hypothetical protein
MPTRSKKRAPRILGDDAVSIVGKKTEFLSLPLRVRTALETVQIPRLQRLRAAIESDAKLSMPPIQVQPWGWIVPGRKNDTVFAVANPLLVGDGCYRWSALFPCSTLFAIDEDALLRRVLCHEFAHCFWYIQKCVREIKDGLWDYYRPVSDSLIESLDDQAARDHLELIIPSDWFGADDARQFLGEYGDPELDAPSRAFRSEWVNAGLPVRRVRVSIHIDGLIEIPGEIERHVQRLDNPAPVSGPKSPPSEQ